MGKRLTLLLLLAVCVPLSADQNPPALYFGGHRFVIGMSKTEALTALSECCTLSPPDTSSDIIAGTRKLLGHFVIPKGHADQSIVGEIYFESGRVALITRPIEPDKFDFANEDVVAFARALDRSLAQDIGYSSATVRISAHHERASNADSESLSLSFPNGRTIHLEIVTLDTPLSGSGKRDSIILDEILEAPHQ